MPSNRDFRGPLSRVMCVLQTACDSEERECGGRRAVYQNSRLLENDPKEEGDVRLRGWMEGRCDSIGWMAMPWADDPHASFTRIVHDHLCCNRGFAAVTSLDAVGTASRQAGSPLGRSTYWFKYASLPRSSARLSRLATARFRDEPS